MDSELSYELNPALYEEAYRTLAEVKAQPLPEAPMDIPIMVPSLSVD